MGTGWRRAFCTSIRRDPESEKPQQSPPSSCVKLGIFSGGGGSNPSTPRLQSQGSTPRLRCRIKSTPSDSPNLQCKTTPVPPTVRPCTPPSASTKGSPRLFQTCSHPSSPRSPSRFALFKATLRFSRSRCGICQQSLRSGQKTAVFTAECSHAFHFPCISAHVRTKSCLACPVCSAAWHQVPLLSSAHPPVVARPNNDQTLLGKWENRLVEEENRGPHKGTNKDETKRRDSDGESRACTATKIYNDDEPLLPSTASRGSSLLHFNPIPEGDDEDDANEEGEGENCYSPSALSPAAASRCIPLEGSGGRGSVIEVTLMSEAVALLSTARSHHQNYVVALKVKAPPLLPPASVAAAAIPANLLDPSRRAPIDLVTVLDVSGGMTMGKLQILKRAMRLVISSLGPADRLSIVAFSAAVAKRLLPLRRMPRQGQRAARQIVDRLVVCNGSQGHPASSSCVGEALRKATKVLEDRRERNSVATIMLLSDTHGQSQQQHQGEEDYRLYHDGGGRTAAATRFAHVEIPIHASGGIFEGGDAVTQQQRKQQRSQNLTPVAAAAEDDAFAKCVKGLVSVVVQDVHLQFGFPSGVISSVYSYGDGGGIGRPVAHGEGGSSVRLGDLYAEEGRELLVELRLPAAVAIGGGHQTMLVKCSYRDPATREVVVCEDLPLLIQLPPPQLQLQSPRPRPQLLCSSSTPMKNAAQQQLRDLFITTRAMAESRRLVDLNDLETAVHLLSSARSLLMQQQHSASMSSHKKLVLALEAELSDLQWRRRQHQPLSPSLRRRNEQVLLSEARGGGGEPLTPTSAWRAAEQLAKVAIMRKSLNRVSDLHGLENARF